MKSLSFTFHNTLNTEALQINRSTVFITLATRFFPVFQMSRCITSVNSSFISEVLHSIFWSDTRYSWPHSNTPGQVTQTIWKVIFWIPLEQVQIPKYAWLLGWLDSSLKILSQ